MNKLSVVTSVYSKDNPEYVKMALESITKIQTRKPDEVILIVDGPIPEELRNIVICMSESMPKLYNVIWLPENKGLGNALRIGVEKAQNNIIARMDSDDIAFRDRFEKQIAFMEQNPDCDIVGGQMSEFIGTEDNIVGYRHVPYRNDDIKQYLKTRCPLNHVTVMMRKNAVLKVGNYQDWHYNEDYFLWIRMALAGCTFANLPDTLVNVRVGKEMYARRGGWKYFKSEARLQHYMLTHRMISFPRYCYNVFGRFVIQVAMPNKLRGFVFQKLFRK